MSVCSQRGRDFSVKILLDCLRGTRRDTLESVADSSLTLLQPLLQKFPNNVSVSFYHTPKLNGVLKQVSFCLCLCVLVYVVCVLVCVCFFVCFGLFCY